MKRSGEKYVAVSLDNAIIEDDDDDELIHHIPKKFYYLSTHYVAFLEVGILVFFFLYTVIGVDWIHSEYSYREAMQVVVFLCLLGGNWYTRRSHERLRSLGYFTFHRRTYAAIHTPLIAMVLGNCCIILMSALTPHTIEGHQEKLFALQVMECIEIGICIVPLFIYTRHVIRHNNGRGVPDVGLPISDAPDAAIEIGEDADGMPAGSVSVNSVSAAHSRHQALNVDPNTGYSTYGPDTGSVSPPELRSHDTHAANDELGDARHSVELKPVAAVEDFSLHRILKRLALKPSTDADELIGKQARFIRFLRNQRKALLKQMKELHEHVRSLEESLQCAHAHTQAELRATLEQKELELRTVAAENDRVAVQLSECETKNQTMKRDLRQVTAQCASLHQDAAATKKQNDRLTLMLEVEKEATVEAQECIDRLQSELNSKVRNKVRP